MARHILSENTLISSLMPSGGGSLASGDTIELDGKNLVLDSDAVNYPITLNNDGATACLELRNGGRIRLNATLQTSVCPSVDPALPLPEANYIAGLTANASAEIQLTGNFPLGGGPALLPSASRSGAAFSSVERQVSSNSFVFSSAIDVHPGDLLLNYTSTDIREVASFDQATRTVVFKSNPNRIQAGDWWIVCAGGIVIRALDSSRTVPIINRDISAGTLNIISDKNSTSNPYAVFDGCAAHANRIVTVAASVGVSNFPIGNGGCDFVAGFLNSGHVLSGTMICADDLMFVRDIDGSAILDVKNLICTNIQIQSIKIGLRNNLKIKTKTNTTISTTGRHSSLLSNLFGFEQKIELDGTVSRVARSDFPTDTDLPDAFYFAPATASDTPWSYEDYWVRRGETLRLSCRAMRGGDNGSAIVAIGEIGVWVPAAVMPVLAEWKLDSGEPLVWRGGSLSWTNDTGEDRQVRVWSMASGIHGAYIRVWRATGGAM